MILVDGREKVGCGKKKNQLAVCCQGRDHRPHSLGHAGTILQPIYIYIRAALKIFKSFN